MNLVLVTVTQAIASDDDGLTLREVFADLPHDPATIGVLLFLVLSVALVVWAGRPRGPSAKGPGGRA